MDYGPVLLTSLGYQLPLMLVWLVGFVFAILRWKWHPRVSLLIVIALVLAFFGSIISVISNLLPLYMSRNMNVAASQIGVYMGIIGVVNILLHFVMWILLIIALFVGRKPAPQAGIS